MYLVTAPFFAIGALLGYFGLSGLIRRLRFGLWHLDLEPPEARERSLRATLYPGRDITPVGDVRCELRCYTVAVMDTGKTRSTNMKVLWETSWNVTAATILKDAGLRLNLPLPEHGKINNNGRPGDGVKWQLSVFVPSPGMSDGPIFELPVHD